MLPSGFCNKIIKHSNNASKTCKKTIVIAKNIFIDFLSSNIIIHEIFLLYLFIFRVQLLYMNSGKIRKSITGNNIILPDINEEININNYIVSLRPSSEEKKSFSQYIDELYSDIPNFGEGVDLLLNYIKDGKKIAIIGDYDVDGTIGTSIFVMYFKFLLESNLFNFTYIYHIPNRFLEGYGPSISTIERFASENVDLIITVDSGTTAVKEVALAKAKNIKTIVLDHHMIQEEVPEADALINCQLSDNFKYLSGGGLGLVFLIHLQKKIKELMPSINAFNFNDFMDLVSLSTVCDYVPLTGINRLFVNYGLAKFNHKYNNKKENLNKAVSVILQYTMYYYNEKTHVRAMDLGFLVGPYLNVAGRMSDGNLIVQFLTETSKEALEDKFFNLQSLWQDRRRIQDNIIENLNIDDSKPYICVHGEEIHEGIMGIIAAQLKEKYYKPTIIISLNGNIGKGSIRSVAPFDAGVLIEEALQENILTKGGGHKMAGGFVIPTNKIDDFYKYIEDYMTNVPVSQVKEIVVDLVVSLKELDRNFYNQIHALGPYGVDYPELNFLFPYLIIKNIFIIANKHLNLRLGNFSNTKSIKAMWFFAPESLLQILKVDMVISVVGNIKMSNGYIEIYILDIIVN